MVKIIFNACLGVVVIALIGIVIRQELLLDRLDNDFERIAEAHNKNADALIKTIKEVKVLHEHLEQPIGTVIKPLEKGEN